MTRVAHLVTRADRRGAEIFATVLADRLAAVGAPGEVRALLPAPGRDALPVRVFATSGRVTPRLFWQVRRWARDYDVVIAHGSRTLPVSVLALLGCRVPLVYVNIGDPDFWAGSWHRRFRTSLLYRRVAAVAAISPRSAAVLERRFRVPRSRLRVIPNGRDHHLFLPTERQQRTTLRRGLGVPAEARVVAYVGALSPEKRVDRLIAAVAQTKNWLIVAGAGSLRAELEQQARQVMGERVIFLGQVGDPRTVYSVADVVALTSESEGLPGVLIEAGLCALPVVATRVGMVEDVVVHAETGILVNVAASTSDLSRALDEAIDQAAFLGASGRARNVEMFGLDTVIEAWTSLLSDVCISAGRQRRPASKWPRSIWYR